MRDYSFSCFLKLFMNTALLSYCYIYIYIYIYIRRKDARTRFRLYYCNSLLTGVGDGVLRKLQSVQNAAARLITDTRKVDQITTVLRDLHWLPVRQRIVFKTAMLVYKCLHSLAPSYLTEFCRPVSTLPGRRQLQSGTTGILHVPRSQTSTGSRSFAVAGSVTCDSLPTQLRKLNLSVASFAERLKTLSKSYWPQPASNSLNSADVPFSDKHTSK